MKRTLMLTGDVNLMNVTDPRVPFARIKDTLRRADVVFGNLECCFYEPPAGHSVEREGFYAPLASADALVIGGFHAVGIANNVNYGEEAIRSSLGRLDGLGIPSTGAGMNRAAARAPAIVTHEGLRFGFVQRTSVYWATGHAATDTSPGVAVLTGHTAYQPPMQTRRPGIPPANRPGIPPAIITWADAASLAEFTGDVRALRAQADVVVASHHWGLFEDVLDYQVQIAHAAIDAAPTWSWDTGRTTRARWRRIAASRSSTASAASRSTRGMAAGPTGTGSACSPDSPSMTRRSTRSRSRWCATTNVTRPVSAIRTWTRRRSSRSCVAARNMERCSRSGAVT